LPRTTSGPSSASSSSWRPTAISPSPTCPDQTPPGRTGCVGVGWSEAGHELHVQVRRIGHACRR
jgi:hypothetical protein